MKISTNIISIKIFVLFQMFICKVMLFQWFLLVFETRKNLDLRKILVTPKIFLKSRFHCTEFGSIFNVSDVRYVNCKYYIWLCVYFYDLKSKSFHIFWYWATYSYKGQITKTHGCKTDTKPCGLKNKSGCKYFLNHQVSAVGGRGNHCSKHTKTWKKIVKFSELVKLSE